MGETAERLLIVRLSAMGDVLQCLEALAALRQARPDAEIGWVVERRFAGLVEGHPHVDRVFVFERQNGGGALSALGALDNLRALVAVRREIRGWHPDVAIDLQGNLKGALLARLSGAARRIGLPRGETREGAHLLATELVPAATDAREHRADRALRLMKPLGATRGAAPMLGAISESARDAVRTALAEIGTTAGSYALLLPGTSDFGRFKRWPAARFAELAARLTEEEGLRALVGFGPGQRPLAEEVVAASAGAAELAPVTDSLHELQALAEGAALVVGADSGPVILAALAGAPTVTLYGPKDPLLYAPRTQRSTAVWKGVYCSPCPLRRCPDPICMSELTTDEAWAGVRRVLSDEAA